MDDTARDLLLAKIAELSSDVKELRQQQSSHQIEQRRENSALFDVLNDLRVQVNVHAAELRTLRSDLVRLNTETERSREDLIDSLTNISTRIDAETEKRHKMEGRLRATSAGSGSAAAGIVAGAAELLRRLLS